MEWGWGRGGVYRAIAEKGALAQQVFNPQYCMTRKKRGG